MSFRCLHHWQNVHEMLCVAALPQTSHRFAPQGLVSLRLGCNFPLNMVNRLNSYRAFIPCDISHSLMTCCMMSCMPSLLQTDYLSGCASQTGSRLLLHHCCFIYAWVSEFHLFSSPLPAFVCQVPRTPLCFAHLCHSPACSSSPPAVTPIEDSTLTETTTLPLKAESMVLFYSSESIFWGIERICGNEH